MLLNLERLPYADNLKVDEIVRSGIPARSAKVLAATLDLSMAQFALIAVIPLRTLERRIKLNSVLNAPESERVIRLGRVLSMATDVFDDKEEASQWMAESLDVLSGRTPIEMCATDAGAREVEQVLGRIEHGVFS
ncbi:MAG TPA: antitoxin Xre/MbcA/ParS toxin-binding domain-containing protein [Candidatus Methylacidiphilales bacterium]|jgi:putative toxin-antitoxin system antitoxin component (TIGR02293 family)|nr:antitoxin Xre/MbcA/ParS toxin-binding domain-containing protein [Candidatus Methylacidiphilales bacterium]